MRRWRVIISDTFIEQEEVIVEAETRAQAKEIANELIEVGDGLPVDNYRELEIELYEDDDE